MDNAYLILEDGTKFCGKSIGSRREVISEVVFNTSMTGYLEVLTAQESLLNAQLSEAMNMYKGAQAVIGLYIALGGGTK